tara:strand:+ start:358 stop:603 length:246 start_codon:yes stop_codon:yes gene_type:complete
MNDIDLMKTITPDIYERFKKAIETGKWNDGTPLTEDQKAITLRAIILYEQVHLREHERVGFTSSYNCEKKMASDEILKWSD